MQVFQNIHLNICSFYFSEPMHIAEHQRSILSLMASRIILIFSNFSSFVPAAFEGSGKLQCVFSSAPGKIGHFSALDSSQTAITCAKRSPFLRRSETAW